MQDHLSKCFEAIDKVVFTEKMEIVAMTSPEREQMDLIEKIDVNEGERKGNVDIWMGELEKVMFKTVKDIMARAHADYYKQERPSWVCSWQGMIILTVNQVEWTDGVEKAIENAHNNGLAEYEAKLEA